MMRSLRIQTFGPPVEALSLVEEPMPSLGPGEVLVEVLASTINPADINRCEGKYGRAAKAGEVPGMEGVGVVVAPEGHELLGVRVVCPSCDNWWASHLVLPSSDLIPVGFPELPDEQAAMLTVNPPTAWGLLHEIVELPQGAWIAQNAANSGVGRCVIQLARQLGHHTINLVRREALVEELRVSGADLVFTGETLERERILEATGGKPVLLGLNATSGPMLRKLTKCLSDGATIVTYGAMAKEPFTLSNAALIFRDFKACGYWISKSKAEKSQAELTALLQDLARRLVHVPVEASYPLTGWREAMAHAIREGRSGKVLFLPARES